MSVDILDHRGVRPEFISIRIADPTQLRFDEFEENLHVARGGIVLCHAFPEILLDAVDVDLVEIIFIDRLDANDLIRQEIGQKLNDILWETSAWKWSDAREQKKLWERTCPISEWARSRDLSEYAEQTSLDRPMSWDIDCPDLSKGNGARTGFSFD